MAKSIRKLLGILTASGFVLLLLSGWFGYRSVQALVHSESDVEKAELTKAQWGDLLSVMKDAENGRTRLCDYRARELPGTLPIRQSGNIQDSCSSPRFD